MKSLTIAVLVIHVLLGLGCDQLGQAYNELTYEGSHESVVLDRVYTADNCVSIGLPTGWKKLGSRRTVDNDFYDLRVGNRSQSCWVEMIVEPSGAKANKLYYQRSAAHFSVSDYSRKCLRMSLDLMAGSYVENGPLPITIDGLSGFQYVVRGRYEGTEIVVLLTHLKSRTAFYQIIAQTRASDLEDVKEQLLAVVRSFDEVSDVKPKFRFKLLPQ